MGRRRPRLDVYFSFQVKCKKPRGIVDPTATEGIALNG